MELSLAYDSTKPWGDMLYDEQQNRKLALLRMPEPEWLACVNAYFTSLRGNGRGLISALAWANVIATERAEFQSPKPKAMAMTEAERDWRVWQDMVNEPEKYGSDIAEWFALDEAVRSGPKRWRVDAFWYGKVREVEELEAAAATKIQALWNGYVARSLLAHRFTCARCLCHGVCTVPWTEPDSYICTACNVEWTTLLKVLGHELEQEEEDYRQEMEEYEARRMEDRMQGLEDEICEDCGEEIVLYAAKVGDSWFCAACIHDWEECDSCEKPHRLGTECDNHCLWCRDSLTGLRATGGYCGRECATDAMREDMKH
jgi:hypothetical protein